MTDGLNLVAKDLTAGGIETIELGLGTQTYIVSIVIIEARHGIGYLRLFLLIPRLLTFIEDRIAIEKAAVDAQKYIDEGGDVDFELNDGLEDYTGTESKSLADQYILRLLRDRHCDYDDDQGYIRTGWKKEFFMIYATVYAMHLIVNTFVRLKYYINLSEIDSILISIAKGFGLIFIPSLFIQKIVFNEMLSFVTFITMFIAIAMSAILIYIKKKNVNKEEITIDNGLMHMKIVLFLTVIIIAVQLIQTI